MEPYAGKANKIVEQNWTNIGTSLYDSINAALSDRSLLDENLDYWNDLYEMVTPPRNDPWPNASNVFVPIVKEQLETLLARLAAVVFANRLFLVNGKTKEAAATQHEVERYYNAESERHGWVEWLYQALHLSLRDGTSVMAVTWKKQVSKRKVVVPVPELDENGAPVLGKDGKPKQTTEVQEIEVEDYNDVSLEPVELGDFIIIPAWQINIEEAAAVAWKRYIAQPELMEMVKGGVLDEKSVEYAMNFVTYGESELARDPQGINTYQAGGKIQVGAEEGTMNPADVEGSPMRMRGPLRIWQVHSRQYDMDGDGIADENVFWVHADSQTLLGWQPYAYFHGRRPFVSLAPMSRPNRFYGFGVPEILRTVQEEANAVHNQRNDQIDLRTSPPLYYREGMKLDNEQGRWGPGAMMAVNEPTDVGVLPIPDVNPSSWTEESLLMQYANKLTGLDSMMGGGRRSAKEAQAIQQSAGVRIDLMANRVRDWLKKIFWQIHHLKLQYGPEEMDTTVQVAGRPERLSLPKAVLAQDYALDIAGAGGPLDRENRRQEMMLLYSMLMQNPLVAGNLIRVWAITQMILEDFNRPDVPNLIGTRDEAEQQMKAQSEAAEKAHQEEVQLQVLAHTKNPKPSDGAPPPQQPQMPQAPSPGGPPQ
jgi:hypothetical protein